jgi:hypothetical protein
MLVNHVQDTGIQKGEKKSSYGKFRFHLAPKMGVRKKFSQKSFA